MNDPIEVAAAIAIVVTSLGGVGVLLLFVRALLRKWSQPRTLPAGDDQRELRHVIDQLAAEVSELNERIDFTERVLATQQDLPKLEGRH